MSFSLARRAAKPLVEAAFIIGCMAFGLAGWPVGLFFIFTIALCFARAFLAHWRKLHVILTVVYALILVFSVDLIAGLWPLVFHTNPWLFAAYVAGVVFAGMFLWWSPILNLRWYHGAAMAMVVPLGVFGFAISRYSTYDSCDRMPGSPYIETLLDYRAAFNDKQLIPRFLALDSREEVLFVANRVDWPRPDSLLRLDLKSRAYSTVDIGLPVGAMTFDPYSDRFVIATYYEPFPDAIRYDRRDAALVWVGRDGQVTKQIPFGTAGDLYTAMYAGEKNIQVFVTEHFYTYDRRTGALSDKSLPFFVLGGTLMNFHMLEDRKLFLYGGPMFEFFFTPSLIAATPQTDEFIVGRKFLTGNYVLDYDEVKKQVYTNAQWSGTLDVLNPDLQLIRSIKLTNVIRALALDSARRRGYVSDYITGEVVAFDLDSAAIIGSVPLAPNARALRVTRGGDVIAGSVCGISRIRPEAFASANTEMAASSAR